MKKQYHGVFHIDGTYKMTVQGYPLIVFGVTDIQGVFHPICFMLTSHETEIDFTTFYNGLYRQCDLMGIEFEPEFVMQDAQESSYNAVKKLFPNVQVLMCYYHVCENIRKKAYPLLSNRDDVYDELKAAVQEMHLSSTEEEFEALKLEFNESFKRFPELLSYMKTQWFEGKFCKWQIFRTLPGFATTNSNIESFNSVIKRDFTSRKRQSIMNAINIINEIIIYYSTNFKDFSLAGNFGRLRNIEINFSNFEEKSSKLKFRNSQTSKCAKYESSKFSIFEINITKLQNFAIFAKISKFRIK